MHSELVKLKKGGLYRGTYPYCFNMGIPPPGVFTHYCRLFGFSVLSTNVLVELRTQWIERSLVHFPDRVLCSVLDQDTLSPNSTGGVGRVGSVSTSLKNC